MTLVVLYEDEMHSTFINAFLHRMRMPAVGHPRLRRKGSKSDVFDAFASEVKALRNSHVQTRLVVMIDADELTDAQIQNMFRQKLKDAGLNDQFNDDAILIICPRWEMENWALQLLGESVDEAKINGARKRVGERGRDAGRLLADTCKARHLPAGALPSMRAACVEWQAHRNRWEY